MPEKKTKVKLVLKNLAILPSYFDYIIVHLRKKHVSGPNEARNFCRIQARTRPEKPCQTYNSDSQDSR